MWNKSREEEFFKKCIERTHTITECMHFVQAQLTRYASMKKYVFFEHKGDNEEELIDFLIWYLSEGLHEIVDLDNCMLVINCMFLTYIELDGDIVKPYLFPKSR